MSLLIWRALICIKGTIDNMRVFNRNWSSDSSCWAELGQNGRALTGGRRPHWSVVGHNLRRAVKTSEQASQEIGQWRHMWTRHKDNPPSSEQVRCESSWKGTQAGWQDNCIAYKGEEVATGTLDGGVNRQHSMGLREKALGSVEGASLWVIVFGNWGAIARDYFWGKSSALAHSHSFNEIKVQISDF